MIWDLDEKLEQARVETDFALTAATPAVSPDGVQLAVGTRSGRVVLLDVRRRRTAVRIKAAHTASVALLRWEEDGRHLLSWGVEGALARWELGERPVSDVQTNQDAFGFALSPNGRHLACGGGPEGWPDQSSSPRHATRNAHKAPRLRR